MAIAGAELTGGPIELAGAAAELLGGDVLEGTTDAGFGVRLGEVGGTLATWTGTGSKETVGVATGVGVTTGAVLVGTTLAVGVGECLTDVGVAVGRVLGFGVGFGVGGCVGGGVGAPASSTSMPTYEM